MYFSYLSSTGSIRQATLWNDVSNPKGIVQLVHGMAEYIDRYTDTARYLNEQGYIVVGHNHPGHGSDAKIKGYFADHDGWEKLLNDIHTVRSETQKQYPDLPYFLLGHSMGSFAVRDYVLSRGKGLSGLIVSGTGHFDKVTLTAASTIAQLQCLFGLGKKPAHLLEKISSKGRNDRYDDVQTPFDWLSRDRNQVRKYVEDPLCGFIFTVKGYRDMFTGLKHLYPQYLNSMEKNLPVLFFSGKDDPVGGFSDGVLMVASEMKKAGVSNITTYLFEGGRHEMFNEINRNEAWKHLSDWLNQVLASSM